MYIRTLALGAMALGFLAPPAFAGEDWNQNKMIGRPSCATLSAAQREEGMKCKTGQSYGFLGMGSFGGGETTTQGLKVAQQPAQTTDQWIYLDTRGEAGRN